MIATSPDPGLPCADCDATSLARATCCGRPYCGQHRIQGDACPLCEQALTRFEASWIPPRAGILFGGAMVGMFIVRVFASPWGFAALLAAMSLGVFAEIRLHKRARFQLLARRGTLHDWQRPRDLPLPAPRRPSLEDALRKSWAYRAIDRLLLRRGSGR